MIGTRLVSCHLLISIGFGLGMQKVELERQMADVHSRYTEALVDSQAQSVACEEVGETLRLSLLIYLLSLLCEILCEPTAFGYR